MDYVLFKNIDDKYLTLKDCIEENRKPAEGEAETGAEGEAKSGEEAAEGAEAGNGAEEAKEDKKDDSKEGEEKEKEKVTVYYVTDPITAEPVHQSVPGAGHGCGDPAPQHRFGLYYPY